MKKVLHLRSSFDPGGTETLLMNLFNCSQEYFHIHLVLLKDGSLISHLRPRHGNNLYQWYRRRFFDLGVFRKLLRLVREQEITIIHTHQFVELCYAVGLKCLNPNLRLIHQIHLMFSKRNIFFYMERFLSQTFAEVLTVSHSSEEELVKRFGFNANNISLLYNAVHLVEADIVDHKSANEQLKLPVQKGRINIVMVANFVWGKDHETIFKAYDDFIREQLPNLSFYFIGKESDISERLRQKYLTKDDLTSGRIVFTGPVPNAKTLLPLFDMVIMSCSSETFNLALVEAAAMGKVILASDIPVFRELSENGRYFHHFKTGDARDLFESLNYLVKNLPEISRKNHAQYYRSKYGFDNFLRSLHEIYTHKGNPMP